MTPALRLSDGAKLRLTLLTLRLSIAGFMGLWALRKIVEPTSAKQVFEVFYAVAPGDALVMVFGAAQLLILIAFALGAAKTLSYGAVLAMHAVSVASTLPRLLDPFAGSNLLFWTGAPVLAALVLLFAMRRDDRWLSLG